MPRRIHGHLCKNTPRAHITPRIVMLLALIFMVVPAIILFRKPSQPVATASSTPAKSSALATPSMPSAPATYSAPPVATTGTNATDLYDTLHDLFEDYAPDLIKEHYDFVSRDQWNQIMGNLETRMETGNMEELASLEPQAKQTLAALQRAPGMSEYATWLAGRMDFIESAKDILAPAPASGTGAISTTSQHGKSVSQVSPIIFRPPHAASTLTSFTPAPNPEKNSFPIEMPPRAAAHIPYALDPRSLQAPRLPIPAARTNIALVIPSSPDARASIPAQIPYYDLWLKRIAKREKPRNADALAPRLKPIFILEKLPAELIWIAEVESSFDSTATSPSGARGLYQLMPAAARAQGLSIFPFDERTSPEKNARAAARHIAALYKRFSSWPLVIAAYNAGESRIAAALKSTPGAKTYADIAPKLPAETRLYVPRVFATIATREKNSLDKFLLQPARTPAITFPAPQTTTNRQPAK